jgi:pimeloyl-ACP methyl ester carboxylesterase
MRYGNSETSVPAGLKVIPPDLQIANGAGALEYTAARPEMNPNAVFVLGYDAGARLVPWIAARYPGTRGMILMGADMLPAEQVLATRTRRELEQQGKSEHDIVQELASQNQLLADIRDGKVPSSRMIYGAPASYWLEWMSRNPLAELRNTRIPVLVVEGGSDREFSQEAYEKLQAALGAAATFRRIEGLNHEFAQVQPGTQVPAVDAKVIEFLRSWMVTHSSGEKKH